MRRIYEFVDKIFEDVPNSDRALQVKEEILLDMEEKVYDLMEEGKSQEDAINKVLVDFGDIDEIKAELKIGGSKKLAYAKLNLGFAIWGSILFIILFIFINFYLHAKHHLVCISYIWHFMVATIHVLLLAP
ncbi:permease prefix domain 1-containing protein [Listeria fleischmannii]|uniref:Uncharacterized protein n=1 Tax=Listeria fleischmannii FSL S10-1203 TaxID=1265822 RepID=W7DXR6_9LIST|nr:hypothetical protein MCOL2_10775 [Listeria fleischmannii FSL S10-1203]